MFTHMFARHFRPLAAWRLGGHGGGLGRRRPTMVGCHWKSALETAAPGRVAVAATVRPAAGRLGGCPQVLRRGNRPGRAQASGADRAQESKALAKRAGDDGQYQPHPHAGPEDPQVQVNNPDILELTPLSPNQSRSAAKKPGVTQINLWGEDKQIYTVDVDGRRRRPRTGHDPAGQVPQDRPEGRARRHRRDDLRLRRPSRTQVPQIIRNRRRVLRPRSSTT